MRRWTRWRGCHKKSWPRASRLRESRGVSCDILGHTQAVFCHLSSTCSLMPPLASFTCMYLPFFSILLSPSSDSVAFCTAATSFSVFSRYLFTTVFSSYVLISSSLLSPVCACPALLRLSPLGPRSYANEIPESDARKTFARSLWVSTDGRICTFTLQNNRFCFRKGASHKSNAVYLVVDRELRTFCQKCHDADCHGFRTASYKLPPQLALPWSSPLSPTVVEAAVTAAADTEATCWTPQSRKRKHMGDTLTPPRSPRTR